ncbi:MAG: GntR family transcriptional regulator [Candidatus Hydrogenedentota bacterium]
MHIHILPSDGQPIYSQIVAQVKYLVAAGRLAPDDELPPVRTLAQQLLINPNTVARAYRELEQAGIVYKRQGAGTYISDAGSPLAAKEKRRILTGRADALVADARHLGFDLDTVLDLVRERYMALDQPGEESG